MCTILYADILRGTNVHDIIRRYIKEGRMCTILYADILRGTNVHDIIRR